MTHQRFFRVAGAALMFVVLAAACGSDDEVGTGAVDEGEGGSGALRDTTTVKPQVVVTTVAPAAQAAPPTTRAAVARTTTPVTQPKPSLEITVNDDERGQYFDPKNPDMFVNTIVRIINGAGNAKTYTITGTYRDSKALAFMTRALKPGEFEDVRLTRVGVIDLADDKRTYAAGAFITVHPR